MALKAIIRAMHPSLKNNMDTPNKVQQKYLRLIFKTLQKEPKKCRNSK